MKVLVKIIVKKVLVLNIIFISVNFFIRKY